MDKLTKLLHLGYGRGFYAEINENDFLATLLSHRSIRAYSLQSLRFGT